MAAPALFVNRATKEAAESLLNSGTGDGAREAVAMLLLAKDQGTGGFDCGSILSQGLAVVIKRPHEALGVAVGASEGEVRRSFRKQALKFHPDKTGGVTTALFQSLQSASQKAIDPNHKPPPPIKKKTPPRAPTNPAPTTKSTYTSSKTYKQEHAETTDPYHPAPWERQEQWKRENDKEEAMKRARRQEAFRAKREQEKAEQAKEYERYRKEKEERDKAQAREANEREYEKAKQRTKDSDEAASKRRQKQQAEEEVFERRRKEEEIAIKKRYEKMRKEEEAASKQAAAARRESEVFKKRQDEEDAAAKLRFFTAQEKARGEERQRQQEEAARLKANAAARRESEVLKRRQREEEEAAKLRFSKAQAKESADRARKAAEEADKVAQQAAQAAEIRKGGEDAYNAEKESLSRTSFGGGSNTAGGWKAAAENAAKKAAQAQETAEAAAQEAAKLEERHAKQARARNMRGVNRDESPELTPFPDDGNKGQNGTGRTGRYRNGGTTFSVGSDGKVKATPGYLDSDSDSGSGEEEGAEKYRFTRPFKPKSGNVDEPKETGKANGLFSDYLRPCNLTANSATSTSVRLEWVGPPKSEYDLQWRVCGNDEVEWVGPARVKKTKCLKHNLDPDTIYEFRVRVASPVSLWSDSIACLTLSPEDDQTPTENKQNEKKTTPSGSDTGSGSGGGGSGGDEEAFVLAWEEVQKRFDAGADEAELKEMLERVAEMYVTDENAAKFMMHKTKMASEKLNRKTADATSSFNAKVYPSSPPHKATYDADMEHVRQINEEIRRQKLNNNGGSGGGYDFNEVEDEMERAAMKASLEEIEKQRKASEENKFKNSYKKRADEHYSDDEHFASDDSNDDSNEDDDEDDDDEIVIQELMLCTDEDEYSHNVRAEPFIASPIVGYLLPGLRVKGTVHVGGWIRVEYHQGRKFSRRKAPLRVDGFGWCLERCDEAVLVPYSEVGAQTAYHSYDSFTEEGSTEGGQEMEDEEGIDFSDTNSWGGGRWHERKDDKTGNSYYWNETTNEISWEKPLWVEEVDPGSGCNYYIRMTDFQSSWRMPAEGALARDEDGLEDFDFDSQVNEGKKSPKWRFWKK